MEERAGTDTIPRWDTAKTIRTWKKMRKERNEINRTLDLNAVRTNGGAGPLLSLLCLDGLDKILAYDLKRREEVGK